MTNEAPKCDDCNDDREVSAEDYTGNMVPCPTCDPASAEPRQPADMTTAELRTELHDQLVRDGCLDAADVVLLTVNGMSLRRLDGRARALAWELARRPRSERKALRERIEDEHWTPPPEPQPPADPREARRHDRIGAALERIIACYHAELIEATIASSCVYQDTRDEAARNAATARGTDASTAHWYLVAALAAYVSHGAEPLESLRLRAVSLAEGANECSTRMAEAIRKARARLAAELGEAPCEG